MTKSETENVFSVCGKKLRNYDVPKNFFISHNICRLIIVI